MSRAPRARMPKVRAAKASSPARAHPPLRSLLSPLRKSAATPRRRIDQRVAPAGHRARTTKTRLYTGRDGDQHRCSCGGGGVSCEPGSAARARARAARNAQLRSGVLRRRKEATASDSSGQVAQAAVVPALRSSEWPHVARGRTHDARTAAGVVRGNPCSRQHRSIVAPAAFGVPKCSARSSVVVVRVLPAFPREVLASRPLPPRGRRAAAVRGSSFRRGRLALPCVQVAHLSLLVLASQKRAHGAHALERHRGAVPVGRGAQQRRRLRATSLADVSPRQRRRHIRLFAFQQRRRFLLAAAAAPAAAHRGQIVERHAAPSG